MERTIVILGASFTGVPIAHYLLKHTAARVRGLKVIIVAPNTHMYWVVASVRGILPNMLADDKLFLPLAPAFAKYPSGQYELVLGKAEGVDPSSNTVEVRLNDGSARTIRYDDLVIATGSSFKGDMPFKNLFTTDATKAALHDWAQRIKTAKSIVVAGAGFTGIELAGELGQEYGVTGKKEITLICDKDLPMDTKYKREVREAAKRELERLKVKVVTNTRATSSPSANNTITLTTTTAMTSPSSEKRRRTTKMTTTTTTTLNADLFIPTYGTTPNTSFLPQSMLDSRGFVKQTPSLRAEGYDNIFVAGDAGNFQDPQGVYGDAQAVHVAKVLDARAAGSEEEAALPEYKPERRIMFGASIGRNRGVGQMGSWRIWGWLVRMAKGKHLGTDWAEGFVRGDRTVVVKDW
ncbi:Apoptosis-inducing factor 2 [Madurella fahalii]|uniref:Apoptosis-inducing factor 2 n=1 Tax=Madurella fahalii TaxID=1157608 RepID=A0ABQ0G965_9PEZI